MNKKKICILFCVLALIIGIALGGIFAYISQSRGTGSEIDRQLKLANRYLSEQNYEEAIIAFQKVLELEPRQMTAYLGLAEAYIGDGQEGEAVSVLEAAQQQIEIAFEPEKAVFQDAEAVLLYLIDLYEDQGQADKAEKVEKQLDLVRQGGTGNSEEALEEEEKSRRPIPQVTEYQIYETFSPLLNWNLLSGAPDTPLLDTMDQVGQRKTFANTCFLYAEQLFPGAGLENQAGRYEAYNRIFNTAGEEASEWITYERNYDPFVSADQMATFSVDYERVAQEAAEDWTAELTFSEEDFKTAVGNWLPNPLKVLEAYNLEEMNRACREMFGTGFQPFTAEELQGYNFYYDESHGIACRKSVIYSGEPQMLDQSIHNYIHDVKQDGNELEFTLDRGVLVLESKISESEYSGQDWVYCEKKEEIPGILEDDPEATVVLPDLYPVVLSGKIIPSLNSLDYNFAYIEAAHYNDSLRYVNAEGVEWIYDPETREEKRAMSKEEVFAALQENVEKLQADTFWKDCYFVPYSVHFKVRVKEKGFEILSMEKMGW